jgi:ABC-type nitrate/sulfonate/bicarbonate transport system substrate-binding protein
VGWDGVERSRLYELLDREKLPHLAQLVKEGSLIDIPVTTGTTQTKPGWAEILTGYGPEVTGVYSNVDYAPVPQGYTIFERLQDYFGKENIVTLFLTGKVSNTGTRGLHRVCVNCLHREPDSHEELPWWDETRFGNIPTYNGEEKQIEPREGEPYFYTKDALDVYLGDLGDASNVGMHALELLEQYQDRLFFAFFHFEEPDEQGHLYDADSVEYTDALMTLDYWLGQLAIKLKELGLYEKTTVYVTSDHGFQNFSHGNAPEVFLAANRSITAASGDRKDITPTILQEYGINLGEFTPPLEGRDLGVRNSPLITIAIREFLSDAPAMIADKLGYYADEGLNVKTIVEEKGKYIAPRLLSGEAQFAILGDKWSVLAQLEDVHAETEIIADLGGGGGRWKIMARNESGIHSLEDLEGKRLGSWLTSYGFAKLHLYLKEKNIRVVPVQLRGEEDGNGMWAQTALESFQDGSIDAAFVWEPFPSLIEEYGLGREIFSFEDMGQEMSVYLHARADFLEQNPNAPQKIFAALERANTFISNNPEEAARIVASRAPTLGNSIAAIHHGMLNIDFALRFDANEDQQLREIAETLQEPQLKIRLNDTYIKQFNNR